ncbi:MAG: stage sporulation protein [Archaeoglobaceae archaeon]|nr:stage sporulation protein [Archaeoglobaceae archaeon]MDK2875778.1 stage sporulation protein [Archaeoglobaceae archaeon]
MELKWIFAMLSAVFLLSVYFGYFLAEMFPDVAQEQIKSLEEFLKDLTLESSPFSIFALILINNSIKSFIAMILGIFFGIVPLFFLFANGLIIGFFAKLIGEKIGLFHFLLLLLPHGILEIPAVILACSYGFWLGIEFAKSRKNIAEKLSFAIGRYLKIVLPMLIIAAMIETTLIVLT